MAERVMIDGHPHIPYTRADVSPQELWQRSMQHRELMEQRRSLRYFSDRPVARDVMEQLIMTGSTAPSGANKQPWTFCAVSDPALKKEIRRLAEEEEYTSYNGRMSEEWLRDLAPLGTDWHKEFLEIAPWLVVVMKRAYVTVPEGDKRNNYYVQESVGLACGFFLSAVHQAGLVALTHTPSPMNFLAKALGRPENERPFLLIPVGYPAEDALVPDIHRKPAQEVIVWYE
jgi:nitroreductase